MLTISRFFNRPESVTPDHRKQIRDALDVLDYKSNKVARILANGQTEFIGLIVPNLVTMFKGDKIRGTLVDTALFGALFVLVCDMIGRVVIAPYELPIELIIGILGSLLFIFMLIYRLNYGRKAVRFKRRDDT